MNISPQPPPAASSSLASTVANAATLGLGGAARSAAELKADKTDLNEALTDMRLNERVRELLDRAFRARVVGAVVENAKVKVRSGKLERQYTVARMPTREIVLLQIPAWILKDGNQIDSLDMLVYTLRGKTVRVLSPDLVGDPSSWFDGLKLNWEQDEKIYIEYVSQSRMAELERGEGDLGNVLKLDLNAVPPSPGQREAGVSPVVKEERATQVRKIRIFLASSEELRADREAFLLYFTELNRQFLDRGLFLDIDHWENFLDAMSETRLQDEYNKSVRACDIFVSLFFTKTGKFTEEEFDTAHRQFQETKRPLIYTFFKNADIKTGSAQEADLQSLWAFKKRLGTLGHFYTGYNNIEHLKLQFRDQLDKLLAGVLGR
jgi:hypothetical protein